MFDILRSDERAGLALRELYHRHGYLPYRMSKFEPYDLYAGNKSFLVSENVLTFTDTDGRLMALKPDVTLSIVKNISDASGVFQKVYYQENVCRTSPTAMGFHEIMQTGLECIGALDLLSMAEVLALAAQSLRLLSSEWLLDLGHMGLVSSLLSSAREPFRTNLLSEIGRKNTAAIQLLCAQAGFPHQQAKKLCCLCQLYGPPAEILPQLEDLAEGSQAQAALEELKRLCAILENQSLAENLQLDFSITNDMSYYNGIIFRGYVPGLPSGVLAGGRYDNLLRRMGKPGGAIGFAVYLDQLERLDNDTTYDIDVLLLYGPDDDPAAVSQMAKMLLDQGRTVRMERHIPQELRYRECIRFSGGGDCQ